MRCHMFLADAYRMPEEVLWTFGLQVLEEFEGPELILLYWSVRFSNDFTGSVIVSRD